MPNTNFEAINQMFQRKAKNVSMDFFAFSTDFMVKSPMLRATH